VVQPYWLYYVISGRVETRLMVVVTMTTWTTQVYKETDMAGGWFLSWGPALRVCPPPPPVSALPSGGLWGVCQGGSVPFSDLPPEKFSG